MPTVPLIEESAASPEVRAVFDDIRASRDVDWINNFWKGAGQRPGHVAAHLGKPQGGHGARALDPLTKELIYLAVSVTNYLRLLHGLARRRGKASWHDQGDVRRADRRRRHGQRDQDRLHDGYRVPVDERFRKPVLIRPRAAGAVLEAPGAG